MALNLNTYGDLKKVINAIALRQKGEKIGNIALGTIIGFIPGADVAKTTFEFIFGSACYYFIQFSNSFFVILCFLFVHISLKNS